MTEPQATEQLVGKHVSIALTDGDTQDGTVLYVRRGAASIGIQDERGTVEVPFELIDPIALMSQLEIVAADRDEAYRLGGRHRADAERATRERNAARAEVERLRDLATIVERAGATLARIRDRKDLTPSAAAAVYEIGAALAAQGAEEGR